MSSRGDEPILVFDRRAVPAADFTSSYAWTRIFEQASASWRWLPRRIAERSARWVQPIPAALVRNEDRYLALRRTRATRSDLRSRVTLLTGGHIDYSEQNVGLDGYLMDTLRRELAEELSLTELRMIAPVGLIVDHSSRKASRHVAFVFEVTVSEVVTAMAAEEFVLESEFSGSFLEPIRLFNFENRFDPWSRLLFHRHISRQIKRSYGYPIERQLALPIT